MKQIRRLAAGCLLLALLLGCAAPQGESAPAEQSVPAQSAASPAQTEPSQTPEETPPPRTDVQTELPPELVEWVQESGWNLPPELLFSQPLPAPDESAAEYPAQFYAEPKIHRYERQEGNSCGGYASAYLLRALGEDVTGEKVYAALGYKILEGLVLPQGIVDHFAAVGHPVTLYQGTLGQLKTRLVSSGKPIVLLIGDGLDYQHYIALLGYDEAGLYFFDSAMPEEMGQLHNRTMTEEEFAPLWENCIPGFERVYFGLDV